MAAEIPDGAVLIARAIFNSSLWTMRDEDRILAITLIGLANWQERKWFDGTEEILIRRGELVRSLADLSESARLSLKKVRTSLKRLEKCGFLARKRAKPYTHITLCKYDFYQTLSNYSDTTSGTARARLGHEGGTGAARDGHEGGNKQEGEEGEEREEGKKGNTGTAFQNGEALAKAKAKVALCKEEATRLKFLEFIGYLENEGTVPSTRILDMTNRLFNMREGMPFDNGLPIDKLFRYALDQAMEHKAASLSYVGKVIQNAVIKWREGALKL